MNDAEYKALVHAVYEGRVLIGVDRAFARKLYTDISTSEIENATGEAPYLEKLVVWFAFLASPIALLVSAIAAVFAFGWWGVVVIPVSIGWWLLNKSESVRGSSSMWIPNLLMISAVGFRFYKILPTSWISGYFSLLTVAIWCDRLVYCASTSFPRAFVLRNPRALEVFSKGIVIRESR